MPRLSKRQQREQEEQEAFEKASQQVDASSEDGNNTIPPNTSTGFAALFTPEEFQGESESEDEGPTLQTKARKSKKKKKKTAVDSEDATTSNVTISPSAAPQKSKGQAKGDTISAKKGKGKEKKTDEDDIDRALAELSLKYPHLQQTSSSRTAASVSKTSTHTLASLLSVSLQHLDSEAEMRKFFGSKVISAAKSSTNSSGGSSRRQQMSVQKSHLTRPQASWLSAQQREGLSIQAYSEDEIEGKMMKQEWIPVDEKWWTVEYSKKYKSVTKSFMEAVMSGDPDNFWRLLQKLPWHADTLLQLSEVYRHREEHSQAVDFVERALFTYERSFIGAFNFTSGLNRLDFDRVENRPFFLALHRQVADLQRRGCVRTAFEFARLLYSIDPWTDPHGALLHLDYLAIKSSMGPWLLDVWDFFDAWGKGDQPCNRLDVTVLPGWAYARALALRNKEDTQKDKNHEASDAALRDAIQAFPEVVPLLADKIDSSLPTEIRRHRAFQIITEGSLSSPSLNFLHLLSHLYAQRSFPLWKDVKRASWFAKTVTDVFPIARWSQPRRDRFLRYFKPLNPRYSAYRHIMILESSYRRLFAFIPREVLASKQLACDPLPPPTTVNEYNAEFFKGADDVFAIRPRTRRDTQRLLERLIPNPVVRRQLQAIFDAQPGLEQRFPGGIVQFAQMVGELPEDALDDIMIAQAMGNDGLNMPGGMPEQVNIFAEDVDDGDGAGQVLLFAEDIGGDVPTGVHTQASVQNDGGMGEVPEDVEGSGNEDEESSEEEYIAPLPVRLLRNIMNRFWGANRGNIEDSSDEDAIDNPSVDDGVDC